MTYDNFQVTLCIERGIEKGSILYRSQLVEHLQQQLNEWSGLLNERTSGYHIFSMVKHCFGQYQETIFARASFTFAMKWWTYLTSFFISGNVVFFSDGAERKIGDRQLPVDGFCDETNTVYQFHGYVEDRILGKDKC